MERSNYKDSMFRMLYLDKRELLMFEREHISESIYCNVFKECRLSWFYTSIGDEV